MTFGDTPVIALGFAALIWASQSHASGIAPLDMSTYVEVPATCQTEAQFYATVIGPHDDLYHLYLQLNAALCAPPSYDVANYVPNDPQFHWDVPPLLPHPSPPAPVPIPASFWVMAAGLACLTALKRGRT